MYVTSVSIGYALGVLLAMADGMFMSRRQADLVRQTARGHAEAAARKEGPYLAPIPFVALLLAGTVLGAVLIGWQR